MMVTTASSSRTVKPRWRSRPDRPFVAVTGVITPLASSKDHTREHPMRGAIEPMGVIVVLPLCVLGGAVSSSLGDDKLRRPQCVSTERVTFGSLGRERYDFSGTARGGMISPTQLVNTEPTAPRGNLTLLTPCLRREEVTKRWQFVHRRHLQDHGTFPLCPGLALQ